MVAKKQRIEIERVEVLKRFAALEAVTLGEAERGPDGRLVRVRLNVFGQGEQWVPISDVTKNLSPWYPSSVL